MLLLLDWDVVLGALSELHSFLALSDRVLVATMTIRKYVDQNEKKVRARLMALPLVHSHAD